MPAGGSSRKDVSARLQEHLKLSRSVGGRWRGVLADYLRQRIRYTRAIAVHRAAGDAGLRSDLPFQLYRFSIAADLNRSRVARQISRQHTELVGACRNTFRTGSGPARP